jgi:hypothetical protein
MAQRQYLGSDPVATVVDFLTDFFTHNALEQAHKVDFTRATYGKASAAAWDAEKAARGVNLAALQRLVEADRKQDHTTLIFGVAAVVAITLLLSGGRR